MVGRKMVRRKDGQIEDGWMARWKEDCLIKNGRMKGGWMEDGEMEDGLIK